MGVIARTGSGSAAKCQSSIRSSMPPTVRSALTCAKQARCWQRRRIFSTAIPTAGAQRHGSFIAARRNGSFRWIDLLLFRGEGWVWGNLFPFPTPPLKERGFRTPLRCAARSEEHTSELQSLMRISYAVFCLKKKNKTHNVNYHRLTVKYHSYDATQH